MSKIRVVSYMSLDGRTNASDQLEILDWYPYDSSLDQVYIDAYVEAEAVLFGRKSFEGLRSYWPTNASKGEPEEMRAVNTMPKLVFSRTLDDPKWQPTRVERELSAERIAALKSEYPKGLLVIGSGSLVTQLLALDLIDELILIVAPTVVGEGEPYFRGNSELIKLQLLSAEPYPNGNLVLKYGRSIR